MQLLNFIFLASIVCIPIHTMEKVKWYITRNEIVEVDKSRVFNNPCQPITVSCNKNFAIILPFHFTADLQHQSWTLPARQNLDGLHLIGDFVQGGEYKKTDPTKLHIFAFIAKEKFKKSIQFIAQNGLQGLTKDVIIESIEGD